MNGRIYDPLLGRFLSADIMVQTPGNLQSFNRYSYIANNPLSGTDPSGFADTFQEWVDKHKDDKDVKAMLSAMDKAGVKGFAADVSAGVVGLVVSSKADQAQPSGATPHAEKAGDEKVASPGDRGQVDSQRSPSSPAGATGANPAGSGGSRPGWYQELERRHGDPHNVVAKNHLERLKAAYSSIRGVYANLARTMPKNSTHAQMNEAAAAALQESDNPFVAAAGRRAALAYKNNDPRGLGGYSAPSGSSVNPVARSEDPRLDALMYLEAEGIRPHEATHDKQYATLWTESHGDTAAYEQTTIGPGSGPRWAQYEYDAWGANIGFIQGVEDYLYPEKK